MNSLYLRHLFTIVRLLLGAFAVVTVGVLAISRSVITEEIRGSAQRNAKFLGAYTTAYLQNGEVYDMLYKDFIKSLALVSDSFIFVTSLDGTASHATDGDNFYPFVRNDVSRAVSDELTSEQVYEGISDLGGIFTEERYLYGVTFTENVGGVAVPVGFVLFSPNEERVDLIWNGVGGLYAVMLLIVLVVAFLAGSYFSAREVKPLNELVEAAQRFGQGDLTTRIVGYENRNDEIGALTREFNLMAEALSQAEDQRTAFINNVSHELKTPMTSISGFVEGLLDGTVPPHKREKSLQIVLTEIRRLSRLVQQMLDLSRLDSNQKEILTEEEFDLIDLLAQVIIGLEGKIVGRGLDVDVDIPDGELMVWGNRDSITQVCYNLLDNAIKFAADASVITVSVLKKDRKAHVSVKNLGEVIEEEELPKLFQRFHKRDYSRSSHPDGLGLGLYIVKSILGALREDITVTSVEGETKFTFTLSLV